MADTKTHVFLTGYPAFTAITMLKTMMEKGLKVTFLVQEKFIDQAKLFIKENAELPGKANYVVGDVVALDLGLSGKEIKSLVRSITHFHHMASIFHLGVPADVTRAVNVKGTRHALALAKEMKRLDRFIFYSTAFVSGYRTGVILEDDLDYGQEFYQKSFLDVNTDQDDIPDDFNFTTCNIDIAFFVVLYGRDENYSPIFSDVVYIGSQYDLN